MTKLDDAASAAPATPDAAPVKKPPLMLWTNRMPMEHVLTSVIDGVAVDVIIAAAIQRYLAADNQASKALGKEDEATAPNQVSEAIRKFRISSGLASE